MTRLTIAIGLSLLLLITAVNANSVNTLLHSTAEQRWKAFQEKYHKSYKNADEERKRFQIYVQNLHKAEKLQLKNPRARFGDTEYMDWSADEFQKTKHNNKKGLHDFWKKTTSQSSPQSYYLPSEKRNVKVSTREKGVFILGQNKKLSLGNQSVPTQWNWAEKGAVTPVKNQGQCGSCWSFSTTGNIEGQWFLAGHTLTSLSEQNLVSCDDLFSFGCNGGFSLFAYTWLIDAQNGWIATEGGYPYVSGGGTNPACKVSPNSTMKMGARINGGKLLLPWVPREMQVFVAEEGPLSVAVDATSFQTYAGGIMTSCESLLPDHQVLIVGYGTSSDNINYWVVKNSWGMSWGEQGYLRIERGLNLCQIELLPNSATVEKKN